MRRTHLLGMMGLALVLTACSRGAADMNYLEESADAERPLGGRRSREKAVDRTPPPSPARTEGKDKRRPAVSLELPDGIEEGTTEGLSLEDALPRLLSSFAFLSTAAERRFRCARNDIPSPKHGIALARIESRLRMVPRRIRGKRRRALSRAHDGLRKQQQGRV